MMLSLICFLSSFAMPRSMPQQAEDPGTHISIRLRTMDAEGNRLVDCPVYFVQDDVPELGSDPKGKPIVLRSDENGQIHTKLPGGHAWKVFAWKRVQEDTLSTEFLDLSVAVDAFDLILVKPRIRAVIVNGLRDWRTALPSGLSLRIEPLGLPVIPVPFPLLGGERIELPPMPRGSFSVVLDHEEFGEVERETVHVYPLVEMRRNPALTAGVYTVKLGQPVLLAGKILGAKDKPVRGAIVRLLLPYTRQSFSAREVRTDTKGHFQMWFPWTWPQGSSDASAPRLLISAPGYLLKLESLHDLCQWISIKTKNRIDPEIFDGLDMARNRVIRLDAAHRLNWTVKRLKASDRFFLRLKLPRNARNPKALPRFRFPIQIDAKGRLELPGDLLVADAKDKLPPFLRGKEQAHDFELYVVRKSHTEMLFYRAQKTALPQQRVFDLEDRKSVLFQVEAGGKTVRDAKLQIVKAVQGFPFFFAPRQLGASGSIRIPLDGGSYWVLARSDRKGMLLQSIQVNADSPDRIVVRLAPYREIRVLTSHPDAGNAVLPLGVGVSVSYDSKLSNLAQHMLRANELRFISSLPKIEKEFVLRVSPRVQRVSVGLAESRKRGQVPRFPRPRRTPRGSGSIDLVHATALVLKIHWR